MLLFCFFIWINSLSFIATSRRLNEALFPWLNDAPLLQIQYPPNDAILAQTDLHIEILIEEKLMQRAGYHIILPSSLCLSMSPVYIPLDIQLDNGTSELQQRCFEQQNISYTSFHISGLVPGITYAIKVILLSRTSIVAISMRTFQVGSIAIPGIYRRSSVAEALDIGIEYHQSGEKSRANEIYQLILNTFPDHIQTLHVYGVSLYQQGKAHHAYPYIARALQGNESDENFHNSMGLCKKAMGMKKDAIHHFRRALELRPSFIEGTLNLGDAYQSIGKWEEAMHEYRKVITTLSTGDQQNMIRANITLDKLVQDTTGRICDLIRVTDGWYEADKCLGEAIVRWPHEAIFRNDHGNLLVHAAQFDQALQEYQVAAQLDSLAGQINVAETLESVGEPDTSIEHYKRILDAIESQNGSREVWTRLKIMQATVLPRILPISQDEIDFFRLRFSTQLDELLDISEKFVSFAFDPSRIPFSTGVTLNTHNVNNRELKQKLGNFYSTFFIEHSIVHEDYVSSYGIIPLPYRQVVEESVYNEENNSYDQVFIKAKTKAKSKGDRLRIGFVSRFIFNKAVGLYLDELLPHLDTSKYEVFVFVVGLSKSMRGMERVAPIAEYIIALPNDLRVSREEIASAKLDLLIYPELGMDKVAYFLSLSRLAPVQALWWGNPDTSGVKTIDYYLASSYEVETAQNHYTENLFRLDGMGIYHELVDIPQINTSREDVRLAIINHFQLTDSGFHFYISIDSILHMHPDFDIAIKMLVTQDPHAHVFLLSISSRRRWMLQLKARLTALVGSAYDDRIHFFIDVNPRQELTLLSAADAVLSSFYYSRPKTSLQCFRVGVPVVTMPGKFWSSRIPYGFYQEMDMNDLVADTVADYVSLAIRLANDYKFQQEMRDKIRDRQSLLFKNEGAILEWERFFDFVAAKLKAE